MSDADLAAIPWQYTDEPGVLLWTWTAPHFVARIVGQEVSAPDGTDRRIIRSYTWELSDLIRRQQGLPRLLVEGIASDFAEAEARIREHVGKAYDPSLGYRAYAGSLAFRYTISSGDVVDVRDFVGTPCTVTVLMPDRSQKTLTGDFMVENYRWRLTTREHDIDVLPEHVLSITNRSAAAQRATEITRLDSYSGVGRIYDEDPRPGCTGRPGYTVGTVDHAGCPRCPLHEEGLPEHLLY